MAVSRIPSIVKISAPFSIISTGTNWVYTADAKIIECSGEDLVLVIPNITAGDSAGRTIDYRVQWSLDGTNWLDYGIESLGVASGGFVLVTLNVDYRTLDAATTGIRSNGCRSLTNLGKFLRVGQRSGGAYSVTCEYSIGLR